MSNYKIVIQGNGNRKEEKIFFLILWLNKHELGKIKYCGISAFHWPFSFLLSMHFYLNAVIKFFFFFSEFSSQCHCRERKKRRMKVGFWFEVRRQEKEKEIEKRWK